MAESIKQIFGKRKGLFVKGSLWIEHNEIPFFGPGPVELLERIEETGSISTAAKQMNMSYKKAWEMINKLNAQTVNPVVIVKAGGKKGGGSTLTEAAHRLIGYHRELRSRFKTFLETETALLNE